MDSRKRTLAKALVWNAIGLIMMMIVGFVATGSLALGGAMAVVNAALGLSLYVIFERVWDRIHWGRHAA